MKTILKHNLGLAAGVAITLAATLVAGCEKRGKFLNASPVEITIAHDGDEAAIQVKASSAWMCNTAAGWLTVTYAGEEALIVTAEANDTPDERRDAIDISSADGQTVYVLVIQEAPPARLPDDTENPENPENPTPAAR
jgi:hypothetical protein